MQWGQIKTLFILCFLILDIFLLHHFINNPIDYAFTEDFSSEENVRNNISGLNNLSEDSPSEEAMLFAEQKEFSAAEVTKIGELPNQTSIILNSQLILSKFDEPLAINVEENPEALSENIWNFDQYQYFGKDEASNTYIFFQKLERPIYFNLSGVLLVQVNEKKEVTKYVQTILEKAEPKKDEEQPEPEEIDTPFDALSGLYFSEGFISSGDEITEKVALGYQNLMPLPNGAQVLAPTWEFVVNNESYFYVNAIEGHLATRKKAEFIQEMKSQINDYFVEGSTTKMEITDEEWDEEDLDLFLEQLLESQVDKQVEPNGVE
ncbi:Two-component signal transduction system YycFG, regulatory protein YycI [Gracilibacillus orientalis]|uniref:Two-component signal transduction system YycFG, regulatory protein YycI n=1 Tax=Gracilibacillus orientalis TaxID=334253 RepID=A0A1I4K5Y5_9BACI|nr:two-component system regulatory protein YycI [Gracilibacillus orientalis]SFL74182.1 Two-component signal transduction system YycFG, regulatory protein YycI [Gracilibacillus orientalis]